MSTFFKKNNTGFAMLFTVLVVTLMLSIAISISNQTFKQTILSNLAKDSQTSFYQADTAVECGMFYDTAGSFPLGTDPAGATSPIICGEHSFQIDQTASRMDYLMYTESVSNPSGPCSSILFDKETLAGSSISVVEGRGYNICTTSPRQVQRALKVQY